MTTTQDFSPEPDLTALRESSEGLVVQMARFGNMVQRLTETVTELRTEFRREIAELRTEFRGEIAELRTEFRGEIAELRGEMAELRTEFRGEIAELRGEVTQLRGEVTELRGEVTQLRGEVTELRGEVTQLRGDMTRGMSTMQTEIRILNRNVTSRLGNNIMLNGDDRLEPLYNLTTGEIIANCPATLGELEQCSATRITALLRELDEVVPRSLEDKRRRLRLAFGVPRLMAGNGCRKWSLSNRRNSNLTPNASRSLRRLSSSDRGPSLYLEHVYNSTMGV
ncbi:hypothetical protein E4U43_007448 [Claviceps pusilla]|uniref:Uncharacterized protein n=1 Tax=Claviceps pusilla TaxID=123648 RepID=A0A9P7NCL1_9HYPO|nr:hypothetical protein E4U43_007448 [Claviceps pusilla]